MKFLHISDIHLDKSLTGGRIKLPFDKAEIRVREARETFLKAMNLAKEERVDFVLIAGDLWEEDNLTKDTVYFVIDTLKQVGVPVVISPGNHDYFSPASHYSNEIVLARYNIKWPSNVHIFKKYEFSHHIFPELKEVCFTGLAYHSNQPVHLRKLSERIDPLEAEFQIAVLHGSRDDSLPPGKMRTLPFNDRELITQPFDYVALGHYHSHSVIVQQDGRIRGAYSGSLTAQSVDELGLHGALLGRVEKGGVNKDDLKFIELETRRINRMKYRISGLTHPMAVENFLKEKLKAEDIRPEDIVFIELEGLYPQGSRIIFSDQFMREQYFYLRIDSSNVQPDWAIEEEELNNPKTTEAIYKARMKELIDEAKARSDSTEVQKLQNALYYGLDALRGLPISQR